VRREVLGDEHVDAAAAGTTPVVPGFIGQSADGSPTSDTPATASVARAT